MERIKVPEITKPLSVLLELTQVLFKEIDSTCWFMSFQYSHKMNTKMSAVMTTYFQRYQNSSQFSQPKVEGCILSLCMTNYEKTKVSFNFKGLKLSKALRKGSSLL